MEREPGNQDACADRRPDEATGSWSIVPTLHARHGAWARQNNRTMSPLTRGDRVSCPRSCEASSERGESAAWPAQAQHFGSYVWNWLGSIEWCFGGLMRVVGGVRVAGVVVGSVRLVVVGVVEAGGVRGRGSGGVWSVVVGRSCLHVEV